MTENKNSIIEITKFVERDFLIAENQSLIPYAEMQSIEEFRKYLTEKLKFLLDDKFDTLVNILYRIDISEKKLSHLFSGNNRDSIPSELADMIIERQLEKIRLRKLYKEGKL
jgi:hypothetical protein